MDLMSLLIRIGADISGAEKGMSEVQQGMDETAKKSASLGTKLKKGFATATKAAAGLAAGATAVGAAVVKLATNAAATADHIDKMSQKIGISREAYQELDFVMSQSGTSVDNLQAGIKTLTANMDQVASGNKNTIETFKKLGVEVKNADGTFRSQEDVFFDTVSALQNVTDQTEKSRLATELFGRSGLELMPLLNGAAGSMDEMRKQAHELGLVMSDESIDAGVKLTDTIDQVKRAFSAVVTQLGVDVMPLMQTALEWVLQHMPEIKEFISNAFNIIKTVIGAVIDVTRDYLIPAFDSIVTFVRDTLAPAITTAWNETIQPAVETAITAIVGFWENTLQPAFQAIWDFISNNIIPVFVSMGEKFEEVKTTYLEPLAAYISEFFVAAWDGLKTFWENKLMPVIDKISEVISAWWKEILQPLGEFIGGTFKAVWEKIVEIWNNKLQPKIQALKDAFDKFKENTLDPLIEWVEGTFIKIWEKVSGFFGGDLTDATNDIGSTFKSLRTKYLEPVWNWIKQFFLATIENIGTVLSGVVDFITNVFQGNWQGAWESVVETFGSVFSTMGELLKAPLNAVIDLVNGMIRGIRDSINTVINGINNKIKITIPRITVSWQGFNADFNNPWWKWSPNLGTVNWPDEAIGHLATGGFLNEGQSAIVGEYRPERLSVVNGHAFVQPIGGIQPGDRFGGNNTYNNTINIYQQPGEDIDVLTERIETVLTRVQKQREAAFA